MRHRREMLGIVLLCVTAIAFIGCGSINPFSTTTTTAPTLSCNNWQLAVASPAFSARNNMQAVVFNGKIWIAGGETSAGVYTNDVWCSSDGITWTCATNSATFSKRFAHTMAVYDGKMWIIGGFDGAQKNDVYYSTDGENWTSATSTAFPSGRSAARAIAFNSKLWAIGGFNGSYLNTVYWTTDGITWNQATASAFTSGGKIYPGVCVYNNKMWVQGGATSGGVTNDVYYSSDGTTWTRSTAFANGAGRLRHELIAASDKMFYIAGQDTSGSDTGTKEDVVSSPDGISWTTVTSSAGFGARTGSGVVIFNGKAWIIAGKNSAGTSLSSIYSSY